MASDRDDRWDDEGDRPRRGGNVIESARRKVSTPAVFLIAFGLIGVLLEVGSLALAFSKPTMIADMYKDMLEKQPPSPQRDDALKQIKENEAAMRMDSPMSLGGYVLGLVVNVLMVVGGLKMKSVSGYGLSMTGAIAGLIPISGCCCLAMPIGLWALITLMNADVKAGYEAVARGAGGGFDDDRG